jgi:chromosome condensin MukBEF MukE localization factor
MMRRLFWLAMGVTIGALVVRKMSKLAEKLTPSGMSNSIGSSLADLAESLRYFGSDVREAMAQREAELRESTGLDGRVGKVQ